MSSSYTNINTPAINAPSSFFVPFSKTLTFHDIDPVFNGETIYMSYSKVICDLPTPIDDNNIVITNYWSPEYYTQMSLSKRFKPAVTFIRESLKVYLNGIQLQDIVSIAVPGNINNADIFYIAGTHSDGLLYVEYIPASSLLFNGNNTQTLMNSTNKTTAIYLQEEVRIDNLVRARKIINNIENYFISKGREYPPTIWIGGGTNASKSCASNIIPGHSPVYYAHLLELQNAVNNIERYMASSLNISYSTTPFAADPITPQSAYMVNYMEQLFVAIYKIENTLGTANI